ncbi:MAG: TonB-dependent receptor [Prevotellaceae bacterium]|jgi:TonB-linked SusC/RagA family outer membrane protein|nr:TonB-dependent receptor [Prevotellaceae bacterium]
MELKKQKKSSSRLFQRVCFVAGICLWWMCGIASANAQGQTKTIAGTVVDAKGETIAGVSVFEKGTTNATMTDVNGTFSIIVREGAALNVSFLGYNTQSYVVGAANTVRIVLQEDSKVLDEVVVVGYGMQRKENLTGAVVSVDVEKTLASRPIADVGRGLQGSVPGLSVVVASGEIGSNPIMKIRGQVGSLQGSSSPLILLDNVEIPSIQLVNPDDIESISVLKDAASASIYGSKGAFGVILITTKKGARTESISVTYSANFSWQNRAKELNMATIDGLQYVLDAARSRNPENPGTGAVGNMWKINEESLARARAWVDKYGSTVKPDDPVLYNRDWYVDAAGVKLGVRTYNAVDALVKDWAPTMTHNLSLNGRSGKTTYYIGLGFLDQSGMTKPAKQDDFKRYNASVSVTTDVNKYLTLHGGAIYSDRTKRYPSQGNIANDPWLYAYRWGSLMPLGTVDQQGNPMQEPVYQLAATTTSSIRNVYMNINLGATINFTEDWNLQFDYAHTKQENISEGSYPTFRGGDILYSPVLWVDENGNQVFVDDEGNITENGGVPAYRFNQIDFWTYGVTSSSISRSSSSTDNNTFNVYSTYNLKLAEWHVFKFMLGMNSSANRWADHWASRTDLLDFENPQFNYAIGTKDMGGGANWDAQLGFFGRINYAFDNKYLLEANLRYDGSSKFPQRVQWQWFPSFSAGWILSHEKFMKPLETILSFAKIRGSYGIVGDQSVSNSLYVPVLSRSETEWLGTDGRYLGFSAPSAVSGDITWQTIANLDIGVDLRLVKNMIGISFDWFRRDTENMIVGGDALPHTYGAGAPQGNYGNLRTYGWEIALDFNYRFANGLGINALATLANASTRVTKGADYLTPWEDRSIGSNWSTGAHYGDIWGYITDRLYQEEDFVHGPDGKIQKTTIIIDGTAKESYELAGTNPVYQTFLENGDGVVIFRPGDVKFVDLNGDGYITSGRGTFGDPGDRKVIGNTTPRYEYGFRLGADYKGFDASIFFQGVGSRQIWGSGQLAIPGFHADDGAMPQAIAGDYWRPDRTGAFYPRAWHNGSSNTNYSLQVQNRYLLNMAYLRIKNITIGYTLPEKWLKKIYLSNARVYASLENFFTFDHLRGLPIDPEAISGYSMFSSNNSYNSGRTGTGSPMFKSASVGVQLSF